MANICSNELHISCSKMNGDIIIKFITETFPSVNVYEDYMDGDTRWIELFFDSKWAFPEEKMEQLIEELIDNDFEATCLSVEWGNYYCSFWTGDKDGWSEE